MARIKYSGLIESINGSIGGTTFQDNKYGFTVKSKPNMVKPNTSRQSDRQLIFSKVIRSWRDLSVAQRDAYNNYASIFPQFSRHNPTSQLSGFNVYGKYNSLRVLADISILKDAGVDKPVTDTLTFRIFRDGPDLFIDTFATIGDQSWSLLFFVSRRFPPSRNFIGTAPLFIAKGESANQFIVITGAYLNVFGSLPAIGETVAMSVSTIAADNPFVLARDSQLYIVEDVE